MIKRFHTLQEWFAVSDFKKMILYKGNKHLLEYMKQLLFMYML